MHLVGVAEAQGRLNDLLDEVEAGGEVLIIRNGQPVARLTPAPAAFDREKAARAAQGLRELGSRLRLEGMTLKELIAAGREGRD